MNIPLLNMKPHRRARYSLRPRCRSLYWLPLVLAAITVVPIAVQADEAAAPPVATRHQMIKECMRKQKASNAGLPKEQMKQNCRDVTETEQENAKAGKKRDDPAAGAPRT